MPDYKKYSEEAKKIYFLELWEKIKDELNLIQKKIDKSLEESKVVEGEKAISIGIISIKKIIENYKN